MKKEITDFQRQWWVDRKIEEEENKGCFSVLMSGLNAIVLGALFFYFLSWVSHNFDLIRDGKDPVRFAAYVNEQVHSIFHHASDSDL